MSGSKFSSSSTTNVVFIGVVTVLSLYVKGISCFRDSSDNKEIHNFRQLVSLEQSDSPHITHSKKNEEAPIPNWNIEAPRIFFLTSPPYQIRLRQEERKAQTSSSPGPHFRYNEANSQNDEHSRTYADSPYKKKMSSSASSVPNGLVSQMGGRGLDESLTEFPKNTRNTMFRQDYGNSNSNPTNLFSNEIDLGHGSSPLYTPIISAHALSNMGKFFEHLRQNLNAIQTEAEAENHATSSEHFRAQQDVPHHQNHYTESHLIRKNLLGDTNKSSKKLQLRATSLNSGAVAPKIRWHPPVTRFYYRDAKSPVAHPVRNEPISSSISESSAVGSSSRSEESHLLLERRLDPGTVDKIQSPKSKLYTDATGVGNGRSTVQTYNPSWSWTNLGLGKRAHVRHR